MVVKFVRESDHFKKVFKKLDKSYGLRVEKLIRKVIDNPEIGKPMQYARKGTRELYIKPFRLSYAYIEKEDKVVLLDLYHKKKQ